MQKRNMLIFYHCGSNTGYAIESLERVFLEMAIAFTGDIKCVHVGYTDMNGGYPNYLPHDFKNIIFFNSANGRIENLRATREYIRENEINVAFGFDQAVSAPTYKTMRLAGITLFVSYWGAPMSSINSGIKLAIKRLGVLLRRYKPDHYIFESDAMAVTAVCGRGIRKADVSVIPLGVNTEKFRPDPNCTEYAYKAFSIPRDRKIIFYSGHMEERKGVHVILKAANELVVRRGRKDVHFLLLGNKYGEEERLKTPYKGTKTEKFVTFGGYRTDVSRILLSCYAGVIASTGWDSFTMSSLEMAAAGVPLIVSQLQGLKETVEFEITGFGFSPGNHLELSGKIETLLNNESLRRQMSVASRKRAIDNFSEKKQVESLTNLMEGLYIKMFS